MEEALAKSLKYYEDKFKKENINFTKLISWTPILSNSDSIAFRKILHNTFDAMINRALGLGSFVDFTGNIKLQIDHAGVIIQSDAGIDEQAFIFACDVPDIPVMISFYERWNLFVSKSFGLVVISKRYK